MWPDSVAFWTGRNRKRERGAWAVVRLCPKAPLMFLDDGAAHRQSDTHALNLRRVERIEKFVDALNGEAYACIPDSHAYAIVGVAPGFDKQLTGPIMNGPHCVRGVAEQVQDHQLKLGAIPADHRQIICELGLKRQGSPRT